MQTGTVTKRGNWWMLRYYENKRQVMVKLAPASEFKNADEVRAAGLTGATLAPINAGNLPVEAPRPLADFIEHTFLPYVEQSKKPSTQKTYRDYLKIVKPHLGKLEVRKVHARDVETILEQVNKAKPRAHNTMLRLRAFFSGVFRLAVRRDLITVNPVQAVVAPEGLPSRQTGFYTLSEVKRIAEALPEPAKTIVLTLALTGLRVGELQGLKWSDIQGGELSIRRNIWRRQVQETPKTEASDAPIPLVPFLQKTLEKHHKAQPASEWIFTGVTGRPIDLDHMLNRKIIPTVRKAGLEWKTVHGFRRGLATNLHEMGVDDLTISRILRHSSVEVTRKHYVKHVAGPSIKAMDKLEEAFRAA